MKPFALFLCLSLIYSGCKTSSDLASAKQSSIANDGYETVNELPQFSDDDEHFLFYWAVWRHLTSEEKTAIGANPSAIISRRDISWSVNECISGNRINMDGENVWYLDELITGNDGLIKPIKEAPRNDFRYITMLNINSQHLRGVGPWIGPKKQPGETMEDWDQRRHRAYLEWLEKSWAKGTKGEIILSADHRLYKNSSLAQEDQWIKPEDYPRLTGLPLQLITKYSPKQWPVYFDERAHKPHSFTEPATWGKTDNFLTQRKFRMRLEWNWCDTNEPVKIEVFVPRGELPPGGPNRPGRTDSGQKKIKITEIDWK